MGVVTALSRAASTAANYASRGDPSSLPSRIAASVRRAEGLLALDLGAESPAKALLEAVEDTQADLV